ncbi:MAG: hypothetical protein BWY28_03253 [bacterium ADurb.Bin236]|nr:MAG: hypothetical protein BWY28_03253 [bacterium ADurb.Bin236]
MKKKKQPSGKSARDIEKCNALITINEPGECLFAIVDFSLPGTNRVRRVISKRTKSTGLITAVMYEGEVGPDNTCSQKTNIMEMKEAAPDKFWKGINLLRKLYEAAGGISDVRLYDGKTMKEAAELMSRFNHARVWMGGAMPGDESGGAR